MAKKQTYAAKAKAIMKKYEPRLGKKFDKGDTLALEAMNQELRALQREQEKERITQLAAQPQAKALQEPRAGREFGQGPRAIPEPQAQQPSPEQMQQMQMQQAQPQLQQPPQGMPPRRGGGLLPTQQFATQQYAKGGKLPKYQGGGGVNMNPFFYPEEQMMLNTGSQFALANQSALNPQMFDMNNPYGFTPSYAQTPTMGGSSIMGGPPAQPVGFAGSGVNFGSSAAQNLNAMAPSQLNQANLMGTKQGSFDVNNDEVNPYFTRVPWWGAAAQGASALLANRQLDLPTGLEGVEDVQAQQIAGAQVDYSRSREQIQRERDRAQAQIRSAARGRGTKQGVTQSTIAGATGTQRVAGQQFTQSQEAESNKNALLRMQTAQFNAQQRAQAQQTNLRTAMLRGQMERENELINAQRRSAQIQGVTGAITGYGKDLMASDRYDQMMNIMTPENYQMIAANDPWYNKWLGVSPEAQMRFRSTGDKVSNTKNV